MNSAKFSVSLILSEIFQTEQVLKTASKFEREILKIGRVIVHAFSNTRMQNMAILRCCFVTYCKQWQRNEQKIITHAFTEIVLVAVKIRDLTHIRRRRRGRRSVKNVFLFYFRISHLFGTIQSVCRY